MFSQFINYLKQKISPSNEMLENNDIHSENIKHTKNFDKYFIFKENKQKGTSN